MGHYTRLAGSSSRRTKADVVAEFRRREILDAARARFAGQGVSETTVEHIAKAAHVAKGTVYLYYGSKDEILRQLLVEDLDELRDSALAAIQAKGNLESRLRGYIAVVLAFFDKRRDFIDHCQIELTPEVRRKVRTVLSQCYTDQVDAWHAVLERAVAEGTVVAASIDGAASNIVSLARGLALHRLAGWPAGPIDPIATRAGRLLWKGLAGR